MRWQFNFSFFGRRIVLSLELQDSYQDMPDVIKTYKRYETQPNYYKND